MAEEEADYGFDDEQDEWRRGSVDIVGEANEDVLSLDGNEEEVNPPSPRKQDVTASGKNVYAEQIPQKATSIPTGPKSLSRGSVPTGPKGNGTRSTEDLREQASTKPGNQDDSLAKAASSPSSNPASQKDLLPLLEGWEMATSRKTGKVFYYHANGQTVWERPTVENPSELQDGVKKDTEAKPAMTTTVIPPSSNDVPKRSEVEVPKGPRAGGDGRDAEKKVPTGPAANDPVASAYARRNAQQSSQGDRSSGQTGAPSGPRDFQTRTYRREMEKQGGNRSRPRSPSPRRDDPKRFRGPDGLTRSPPRLDSSRYARSPPRTAAPRAPPQAPREDNDRDVRSRPGPPPDREVSSGQDGNGPPSYAQVRPPSGPVRGPNTAPITNNRWGNRVNGNQVSATPSDARRDPPPSRPSSDTQSRTASRAVSPGPNSSANTPESDAAARRAALAEKRRKAEEEIKALAEEEARLEREEKALQEKKEEQARREKELDAKRAEEEEERKRSAQRDADRKREEGDRSRGRGWSGQPAHGPPRGGRSPMRARSPPPRMRSPIRARSPPRGPPLGLAGRMRMDDAPSVGRPRERSPVRWRGDRPPSPPRRSIAGPGDTYRPSDGPNDLPLASRLTFPNRDNRDRGPPGNFGPPRDSDLYRPDADRPLPPRRNSPPPSFPPRHDGPPRRGGPEPFYPDRRDEPWGGPRGMRDDSRGPPPPRDGRPLTERLGGRAQTARMFAEPMSEQARRFDQRIRPRSPGPIRPRSPGPVRPRSPGPMRPRSPGPMRPRSKSPPPPRSLAERMSRPGPDDRNRFSEPRRY